MSFAAAGMVGFLSSRISKTMETAANPLDAAIAGYQNTFLLAAIVALCGCVLAFFLRKPLVKEVGKL